MRKSAAILLGLVTSFVLSAATVRAADAWVDLQCFTDDGTFTGLWATGVGGDEAAPGASGTETQGWGFGFNYTGGDREMQCTWRVPGNYDPDAATPPEIRLAGWSTTVDVCLSSCPSNRYVELEVSSRNYNNLLGGTSLEESWSSADAASFSFEGATCSSATCYPRWHMRSAVADATPDAGDWAVDDLVFIRTKRDTGISNNLLSKFFLAHVQLKYTTE